MTNLLSTLKKYTLDLADDQIARYFARKADKHEEKTGEDKYILACRYCMKSKLAAKVGYVHTALINLGEGIFIGFFLNPLINNYEIHKNMLQKEYREFKTNEGLLDERMESMLKEDKKTRLFYTTFPIFNIGMSAYTASQFSDEKYALAITIYGCASILKQGLWTGLIASKYLRTIDDDLLKQKSIVRQGIDNVKEKIPKINTLPEPELAYRTIDDLI